jgi:hypothetical protein
MANGTSWTRQQSTWFPWIPTHRSKEAGGVFEQVLRKPACSWQIFLCPGGRYGAERQSMICHEQAKTSRSERLLHSAQVHVLQARLLMERELRSTTDFRRRRALARVVDAPRARDFLGTPCCRQYYCGGTVKHTLKACSCIDLGRYAEQIHDLGCYAFITREPKPFCAVLGELVAIASFLDAHQARWRSCDRGGSQ